MKKRMARSYAAWGVLFAVLTLLGCGIARLIGSSPAQVGVTLAGAFLVIVSLGFLAVTVAIAGDEDEPLSEDEVAALTDDYDEDEVDIDGIPKPRRPLSDPTRY